MSVVLKFNHQVLIGSHVYGEGEVVEADYKLARFALDHRHAVEYVPPVVREAIAAESSQARKATKKA